VIWATSFIFSFYFQARLEDEGGVQDLVRHIYLSLCSQREGGMILLLWVGALWQAQFHPYRKEASPYTKLWWLC